ncbi:cysteine hydrolase [Pediococcus inopinatus]|uniref:Cysteine hydrolase n=1 Tax=Pediococcus inopinatus TaxID=114090 RepID=A0ABZ0Q5P3_9LACO|nr:isochorismatase family cysteine hydrolase [Pediococcus inopinatus]WPC22313.1 cysteine hydrolase [Pediococcus inopinatus]
MKSAEALLIIDYTNDFVADQGSLTTAKPGQEIQSQIIKLANEFKQNGNFIIFPTDLHDLNDPYHPETKLFPPHNLAETWGHELYDQVQQWYQKNQNSSQVYYYNKNRYSAFVNSNLDNFLRSRHIKKLTLVGVCTDICILHTAVSAYNLNYQLRIPASAVASFDPAGHKWALNHFKTCLGAEII